MPRKETVEMMKLRLARLDERKADAEKALSDLEEKREKIYAKLIEEERKIRTHNLCEVGGLVYKYFGENLTGEQFKAILDVLFKMDGVQEFVNSEKDKRILTDNADTEITITPVDENVDEEGKAEPNVYYGSGKFSA